MSSILKKKSDKKSSRRNVSFSTTTSTSTFDRAPLDRNDDDRPSAYARPMNDDEDDAFDPVNDSSSSSQKDGGSITKSQDQQIRDAKSKRALRRFTGSGDMDFEEHDTDGGSSKRDRHGIARGRKDELYDGEEEVDEHYSLLHEQQQQKQHGDDGEIDLSRNDEHGNKEQCPIEPFNMTAEREDGEGYFDGDTYIFRRGTGRDEEADAWLDDLKQDGGDIHDNTQNLPEKAMDIESMIRQRGGRSASGGTTLTTNTHESLTKEQLYQQIIPLLATETENVMQALSRYGAIIKREKKANKVSKAEAASKRKYESASTKALDLLTELSGLCMMKFDDMNIYEHNRSFFADALGKNTSGEVQRKRSYFGAESEEPLEKRPRGTSNTPGKMEQNVLWEYRGNQDHSIHGPYTTNQMLDWIKAGYFIGATAVDVRIVRPSEATNGNSVAEEVVMQGKGKPEVVDDLLGDLEDSDDEAEADDEKGSDTQNNAASQNWQRSDEVDFSSYL